MATSGAGTIPIQAFAFLGAVAAFLILLVIFFLYLNKKLCFAECGGFPCIDKPIKKESKSARLGAAYAYDDETSSDSDDDVLRKYQSMHKQGPNGNQQSAGPSPRGSEYGSRSHQLYPTAGYSGSNISKRSSQRSSLSAASTSSRKKADSLAPSKETEQLISFVEEGGQRTSDKTAVSASTGAGDIGMEPVIATDDPEAAPGASGLVYSNTAFQQSGDVSPDQPSQTSSEHGMSQYGDTASVSVDNEQDEHLFDVSDLQDQEPVIISKCGNLEVTFNYDAILQRMNITIHQALEIPSKDRGGASNSQIRLLLLPTKKTRHKTKIKAGGNPEFQETFQFKVPLEEVNNMGVRFRLYGCERMRRERMIGESVVGFASLNLDMETTHWLTLEPRSNLSQAESKLDIASLTRSDSASSTQSMQHGGMPELLIGLAYNGTTGRLSVEIMKGSNFRNMAMTRAPDTYVKLTLMSPQGQEITRSKTSIRRGQPNPLYKETFMFQVALFQLPDVTLMVSVYNKRSMKRKEMIGWFSLGLNNSGEEELAHWNEMRESKGEQTCRWHVLLES